MLRSISVIRKSSERATVNAGEIMHRLAGEKIHQ